MKVRKMLGIGTLENAKVLVAKNIPITTIVKLLGIDEYMHYRTAYDILNADSRGYEKATRPPWLADEPVAQGAPDGWFLIDGMTEEGDWIYRGD